MSPVSAAGMERLTGGVCVAVDVDYYEILGVGRTVSEDEIREAHKRQSRVWRKRADSSSDLSIRQEAELRVKWLKEAFDVLLNGPRRAEYDRELAAAPPRASSQSPQAGAGNWLQRARDYLGRGDYSSAVYAAREVTREAGASAEGWVLLSRANAGLRRYEDAIYEGQQAVALEPANADYHFNVGLVAEQLGRWDQAIGEYHAAAQQDPSQPLYQLAVGGVYLQNAQLAEALRLIEAVYHRAPDDEVSNYYYAQVLIKLAEAVPRQQTRDTYVVTSAQEVARMRDYMRLASVLKHHDEETAAAIAHINGHLDRMERKTFNVPAGFWLVGLAGAQGGCLATVVGVAAAVAVFLLPVILVLWGLGSLASGSAGGLIVLLLGAGVSYLWYWLMWVPGWKVNARRR
jgi:tetratricopeptide (TPR) repeat protein